jgi:hypothetical protein
VLYPQNARQKHIGPGESLSKIALRVAEDVLVTLHFVFKLRTILLRQMTFSKVFDIHVTCSSYRENLCQPGLSVIIIIGIISPLYLHKM